MPSEGQFDDLVDRGVHRVEELDPQMRAMFFIPAASRPVLRVGAVARWASGIWSAYGDLHSTVRYWVDLALAK